MSTIPLLDTTRSLPQLEAPLTAAFLRVLRSGQYILGAEVEAFENAVATYCGVPHAVGVSSGSDALLLALMALQLQAGDEVLLPSYTFFATAGSVWRLGATPVFVDNCPGCFNLLPSATAAACTPRSRGLLPVHLFGQLAALAPLRALASQQNLWLLEDAAQALGAGPAPAASPDSPHMACYSFFPSKNLGAFGDAGMLTCADTALAQRLRILRTHGAAPKYHHHWVGGNFRLDALQAALLHVKLPYLNDASAQRRAHAAHYTALFEAAGIATAGCCLCDSNTATPSHTQLGAAAAPHHGLHSKAPLILPVQLPAQRGRHVFNQYVIRINQADNDAGAARHAVRHALTAQGIGSEIYYPIPLHQQRCFASLPQARQCLPHAERAARQTLALPIFPELHPHEIERTAQCVINAIQRPSRLPLPRSSPRQAIPPHASPPPSS